MRTFSQNPCISSRGKSARRSMLSPSSIATASESAGGS